MPEQQNRNRGAQINIRLTDDEAAEVRAQARRRGISITRLILAAIRYVSKLPYEEGFRTPNP